MRRVLSLLALALTLPAAAQKPTAVTPAKPNRTLKDAMLAELTSPQVQIAIGVTGTQRNLQETRLAADGMETTLKLMRVAAQAEDEDGVATFTAFFSATPAKALFPFLAENQVAKLRRLTLAHQPLVALGTDEVAFALTLTAAQRKGLDSLFAQEARDAIDPRRPSVKLLTAAMKDISASMGKVAEDTDDYSITVEKIDKIRPLFARLFRAIERSVQLRDKEAPVRSHDPLALLNAAQIRRYRELSGTTSVAVTHPARVAKRG